MKLILSWNSSCTSVTDRAPPCWPGIRNARLWLPAYWQPLTRTKRLQSTAWLIFSLLQSVNFSQPGKSWACWCCIPMSKPCFPQRVAGRQPKLYVAARDRGRCVNGRAAFPLKILNILNQWGNNRATFLCVCALRVSGGPPGMGPHL